MIILKHLKVERFRLLREIDLHFPERGSILIQGPNEAGKSTLFESIYFALFGEAIIMDRGKSSLDDLIRYGEASAVVTLTLANTELELTVTRVIERGKGQQVMLHAQKHGKLDQEVITNLDVANQRIIAEFGGIDSEALRDSCFVEQKGLNRLENLPAEQRDETLRKLLGLEKLSTLTSQFTLTPADESALQESSERTQLAEIQDRIPAVSDKLHQIEMALDALLVAADLAEIRRQEEEIAGQEQLLAQLRAKRPQLKTTLTRIQQLKRADKTFADIIAAYDSITEAQSELPELEREIAELDRRERSELPGLEKRVNDLLDLTHSFSTLERMSNDLLFCVNSIKELERDLKHEQTLQEQSGSLDEQIIRARLELDQSRHKLNELENRLHAERPQLQARLKRLRRLAERTITLYLVEEQFAQRLKQQSQAQDNRAQAAQQQEELEDVSQSLATCEAQEQELQQQANAIQQQLNHHQLQGRLEEWQRLKKLSQELANAEQEVMAAHQRQEQLNSALLNARRKAMSWLMGGIAGVILALVVLILMLSIHLGTQHTSSLVLLILLILLLIGGAGYCCYRYTIANKQKHAADAEAQAAISQVSSTVAVREAAARIGDNREALGHCAQEIQALGGTVPDSFEDAQQLLQDMPLPPPQDVTGIEQQLAAARAATESAHQQTEAARASIATISQELNTLEEEYKNQRWDEIEAKLRADKASMKQKQQEIGSLAGQEGLPIPNLDTSITQPIVSNAQLEMLVTEAIAATEQEIAALEGQISNSNGLAAQVKSQQSALDVLQAQRQAIAEEEERYHSRDLAQHLKQAHEQQHSLSDALQNLQDSLRQRVKQLNLSFGQTAINNAEASARKQLESLNMSLSGRVELQSRHAHYVSVLKDRQEALAAYYHQLAKMSATLGNWIVPLNPFAGALQGLQARCRREIYEANENGLLQELETLDLQEGAVTASVQLYHEEIERVQEHIAALLTQHHRLAPSHATQQQIITAWPLIEAHSLQDRPGLEQDRRELEQTMRELEREELDMSTRLQTGGAKLNLERERANLQQQQRSYAAKQYGGLLIQAVNERMMSKILPRIEYCIQQILPLLTHGRYHEVQLGLGEDAEAGVGSEAVFQMRVWDTAANAYIAKERLSGGSADQLSLALRLAFVIAALPREAHSVPGFLLLDEPLSSFDRERTQALVDALKSDVINQHFEQVLFISHVSVFDTAIFPYTIYMEAGRVIESNLPTLPTLPESPMPDESNTQAPVPASVAVES